MNFVEPIRDLDDIQAMKDYLREWNERNYMLFVFGINLGLRISDIIKLKVKDVHGQYVNIREMKTGKIIKRKMNKSLRREVQEYIQDMNPHDYLFRSRKGKNKPITREAAYYILKVAAADIGVENVGTHTMRKTFGYHQYKNKKDVAMLMTLFNHASPDITLRYIGIQQDQQDKSMDDFYL